MSEPDLLPVGFDLGLETPGYQLACLQHARCRWGIQTWGWKPQAINLRAFSTPVVVGESRLGVETSGDQLACLQDASMALSRDDAVGQEAIAKQILAQTEE